MRLDEHVDGIVSSIGPRLKHLRQERHFSLQQLAARAEVSAAAIHKIERNDMVPTITTLLKIATALDRPVSYFVDNDEGPRAGGVHPGRQSARGVHAARRFPSPACPVLRAVSERCRRRDGRVGANSGDGRWFTPAKNWSLSSKAS